MVTRAAALLEPASGVAPDDCARGGAPSTSAQEALARAGLPVRRATQSGCSPRWRTPRTPRRASVAHAADVGGAAAGPPPARPGRDEERRARRPTLAEGRDREAREVFARPGGVPGAHLDARGARSLRRVEKVERDELTTSTSRSPPRDATARRRAPPPLAALIAEAQLASGARTAALRGGAAAGPHHGAGLRADGARASLAPIARDLLGLAAALRALAAAVADADAVFGPDLRPVDRRGGDGAGGGDDRDAGTAWDHERYGQAFGRAICRRARRRKVEALEALASTLSERWRRASRRRRRRRRRRRARRRTRRAPSRSMGGARAPLRRREGRLAGFTARGERPNDANARLARDARRRGGELRARRCGVRASVPPVAVTLPHAIGPVADAGARGAAPSAAALAAWPRSSSWGARTRGGRDARPKHVLAALQLGVQSGDAATARAAARAAAGLTEHAGHALASLPAGDERRAVRADPVEALLGRSRAAGGRG